jgi:hypothetical protein
VIVLDENLPDSQRRLLRSWRIRVQQIGHELGRPGMRDAEIVPFLRRLQRRTFFTRDDWFYQPTHRHSGNCLVLLAVAEDEAASFIRRVLRHPVLNTHRKRMGTVVRATHAGLRLWRLDSNIEERLAWPPSGGAR